MRILLDTNFLYSALFHPSAKFNAIIEFVFTANETIILDYVGEELIRKAKEKRPDSIDIIYAFLEHTREWPAGDVRKDIGSPRMQDPKDQPILDAASRYSVDIVISGDKHFLTLDIDRPRIMSPAQFIAEFLPHLD